MTGALEGVRILDMTIWQQGTAASAMLADLGADVIKIEEPVSGDPGRGLLRVEREGGVSGYFQALNRGKRSIAIDLKQAAGREALLRLARDADAFLTNYRPGVAERLRLGYADLAKVNPSIIYARASGYGPQGPDAEQGSFDILGQARGGLMAITGEPDGMPKNVGAPIADQVGGMMAAFAILAALLHRERTGEGQEVDVSLLGSVMALQSFNITQYHLSGELPSRFSRAGRTPFWNMYRGSDDSYFAIGLLLDRGWRDICDVIGRPELIDDERFASHDDRVGERTDELMTILDEAFAQRPAAEWVRLLGERGVFCAPVQDYEELANDPQVIANGYLVDVERPDGPPLRMVPTPVQLSKTPASIRGMAPELGQHTEEVLLEAGFTWPEIEALRGEGVIGPMQETKA
ncbi:MAG: CoA transferase [Chloroflexi bacterium]|nr:CoA transferase [Chloroflexota bacterium]